MFSKWFQAHTAGRPRDVPSPLARGEPLPLPEQRRQAGSGIGDPRPSSGRRPARQAAVGSVMLGHGPALPPVGGSCCCGSGRSRCRRTGRARSSGSRRGRRRRSRSTGSWPGTPRRPRRYSGDPAGRRRPRRPGSRPAASSSTLPRGEVAVAGVGEAGQLRREQQHPAVVRRSSGSGRARRGSSSSARAVEHRAGVPQRPLDLPQVDPRVAPPGRDQLRPERPHRVGGVARWTRALTPSCSSMLMPEHVAAEVEEVRRRARRPGPAGAPRPRTAPRTAMPCRRSVVDAPAGSGRTPGGRPG